MLNKTTASSRLTLAVDTLPPETRDYAALSMTLVAIPDAADAGTQAIQYTADLADPGLPPQAVP